MILYNFSNEKGKVPAAPAVTTIVELLRLERPAAKANGTVNPSLRPMIISLL